MIYNPVTLSKQFFFFFISRYNKNVLFLLFSINWAIIWATSVIVHIYRIPIIEWGSRQSFWPSITYESRVPSERWCDFHFLVIIIYFFFSFLVFFFCSHRKPKIIRDSNEASLCKQNAKPHRNRIIRWTIARDKRCMSRSVQFMVHRLLTVHKSL